MFNVQFQFIYTNMQQGPLFNTLLTEYSDPTILDSLDMLEEFSNESFPEAGDELQYLIFPGDNVGIVKSDLGTSRDVSRKISDLQI